MTNLKLLKFWKKQKWQERIQQRIDGLTQLSVLIPSDVNRRLNKECKTRGVKKRFLITSIFEEFLG